MEWSVIKELIIILNYIFLYYVLMVNILYFVQLTAAALSLDKYNKKLSYSDFKKYVSSENMMPISILVPAYNEGETIVDNIKALMSLNYPHFEVVVVNDGSEDNTLDKVIETFNLVPVKQPVRYRIATKRIRGIYKNVDQPKLVLVDKENGGKADALNTGINQSRYPLFAAIDADSIIEKDSMIKATMPFIEDKEVIAVGGIVRIANGSTFSHGLIKDIKLPKNKIAMFQTMEYLRAFLTGRMGWDTMGALLIISGAFGVFNKGAVVEAGGFTVNTIGEDMELVIKLHRYMKENNRKYKIKFLPDPVCWTQAPERIKDLKSQRVRWQIGLMDSLLRHREILFNPKYGAMGILAAPYFWFVEMLGPVIELTGYVSIPLAYLTGILNYDFFIMFLSVSILYGIFLSIGTLMLEEYTFKKYPDFKQLVKLSFYAVIENFGYRQLTLLFRLEGLLNFKKKKHSWEKITRISFSENILQVQEQ